MTTQTRQMHSLRALLNWLAEPLSTAFAMQQAPWPFESHGLSSSGIWLFLRFSRSLKCKKCLPAAPHCRVCCVKSHPLQPELLAERTETAGSGGCGPARSFATACACPLSSFPGPLKPRILACWGRHLRLPGQLA